MSDHKISSVLELANYKIGDTAWYVSLKPARNFPDIQDNDQWMFNTHPKTLYSGPYKRVWGSKAATPRLQDRDFTAVVDVLVSKLVVSVFPICDIIRSSSTGEFYYNNDSDEWMPESCLMDTKIAANNERTRILKLFEQWRKAQIETKQ